MIKDDEIVIYGMADPINAKVTINGIEITDVDSWNKVIDSIRELKEENQRLKEEYIMLQNASEEYEDKLLKENQRLNNVLNELEKYANKLYDDENYLSCGAGRILNKLNELKESDK